MKGNSLIGSNISINSNILNNFSYINYNFLKGDNLYIQTNELTGNNCSISNNNLNSYQNTIRENDLISSNSAINYNTMLGSENVIRENEFNSTYAKIENNNFTSECEIWGNEINGSEISNNNLFEDSTISYNVINENIWYNILKIKNNLSYNIVNNIIESNEFLGEASIGNSEINGSFTNNNLFNFNMNSVILNHAITRSSFTNYTLLTATTSYDNSFFIGNLPTSSTLDNIYIKKDNQIKEISLNDFNNLLNINISGSSFNPLIDVIGDISANTNTILDNDTVNVAFSKTQGQINNLIPKAGTTELTGDIIRSGDGESYFGVVNGTNSSRLDTYVDGSIRILENLALTGGNSYSGTFMRSGTDVAEWNAGVQGTTSDKTFSFKLNQAFLLEGAEIAYDIDRTTEINANPLALINRAYADAKYALSGSTGSTNLGYTPSPTNGIVTSDTGTDATLTLADGTNAGLLKPDKFTVLENTTNTNSGDNATNTTSNAYADAKVTDAIVDGVTTVAPSQNVVFDALALKQDTLTTANFATFINSTPDKTTPVDADIVPIVDVSTGKRTSLSNFFTNWFLPKLIANNSSAPSGYVGEVLSSSGFYTGIGPAIITNVGSLSLPAGDYDVESSVEIIFNSGTTGGTVATSISENAALNLLGTVIIRYPYVAWSITGAKLQSGRIIVRKASTGNVYCCAYQEFGGGTCDVRWQIVARRVR
jgi:hypothetical protein